MNKKAALELSITAIVVLIIAVTVLGLGIGFIKKQFGAGTELFTREYSNIKDQMKEQIRTGGELLVFSAPEQVSIGKPQATVIGVRNTAANTENPQRGVCFRVEVTCIKPFTPGSYCDNDAMLNNIAVGGYDMSSDTATGGAIAVEQPEHNWFRSLLGEFELKNYEGDVYDAVMLVRGVPPDSYAMEINVYKSPNNLGCTATEGNWFGADGYPELYASKTFTLNVV